MGKLHYITALLLIILLAIASGWIFESIEKSPIGTKEKVRHDPDYFLKNFTAKTMDDKGKLAYKIKANYLEHFPDNNSLVLQQPTFSFYEKNTVNWTAKAHSAVVLESDDIMNLSGNVVFEQIKDKNNDSLSLSAEKLSIEPKKNLAHTKSKIKLNKENSSIQAIGMRADMKSNKIEFISNTKSHYSWSTNLNKHIVDIKADSLLLDEIKGVSKYKGHVLFTKGTLVIKADAITLLYENKTVVKAIISGSPADVRHQPDNEAKVHSQANNMTFFVDQEHLLLKGGAFVDQGDRHFSGETIEYDTRQRSITAASRKNMTNNVKNDPSQGRVHVIIGPVKDDEKTNNEEDEK